MQLQKIVKATNALIRLGQKELPLHLAYSISKLLVIAQKDLDFYTTERDKILAKYEGQSEETIVQFIKELDTFETSNIYSPIVIPANLNITVTAHDLIALEDFVTFEI